MPLALTFCPRMTRRYLVSAVSAASATLLKSPDTIRPAPFCLFFFVCGRRKALDRDRGKKSKKSRKVGGRKNSKKAKRGRKDKDLTPDRSLESLLDELVQAGVIRSHPPATVTHFIGPASTIDPMQRKCKRDSLPLMGDIRSAVIEHCIFPLGKYTSTSEQVYSSLLVPSIPMHSVSIGLVF